MSTLKQMGIQQWRLKADSTVVAMPPAGPEPSLSSDDLRSESAPKVSALGQSPAISKPTLSWDSLSRAITDQTVCQHCAELDPMLGAGDKQADCTFIISMPSANDMQRQQLLSGRDGQLFDAMLRAMALKREQIYLTSASKCVIEDESAGPRPCVQLLHQQFALIQPKVIVALGQQAAQQVIKSNESLPALRGQTQKCHNSTVPVIVTHDLSSLLAQPTLKAEAWQDLRTVIHLLATANAL